MGTDEWDRPWKYPMRDPAPMKRKRLREPVKEIEPATWELVEYEDETLQVRTCTRKEWNRIRHRPIFYSDWEGFRRQTSLDEWQRHLAEVRQEAEDRE